MDTGGHAISSVQFSVEVPQLRKGDAMMSRVFYMLVALVISSPVNAMKLPDFTGATYVDHGTCEMDGKQVFCVEIEKEKVHYLIYYENLKIKGIYRIHEGAEQPYDEDDMEQIYPLPGVEI